MSAGCGCGSNSRFLCSQCSHCSNCCECGGGSPQNYSNNNNNNNCSSNNNNNSCSMPPLANLPNIPNLPQEPFSTPFSCPSAVLHNYPPDCCGPRYPDISHPCPWPWYKRVFVPGCPIIPGYQGHIPGFRLHGAGRTFGDATRDTCCIMGQWGNCCCILPCRIFEQ